jgi:pimeloyl-ACP methyl ester carboxylesterase
MTQSTTKAKQPIRSVAVASAFPPTTTYHRALIDGLDVFYREAGPSTGPVIVLLHGFPSSSHMFRELIPRLATRFRVIAPDYVGFGYSAHPPADQFRYTFDNLTAIVERLLFSELGLSRFALYVQDYGSPVGFRIATRHPDAIDAIVIQNGNAYLEGISEAFAAFGPFWANRSPDTEKPIRALLTADFTRFQYMHGAGRPERVCPDAYVFDQIFLDRAGNDRVQLDLFHDYQSNVSLYPEWQEYFRRQRPRTLIVWGKNDPFFTEAGARAYLRDLPDAELHLLDGGHFVLEQEVEIAAELIHRFLGESER